MPVANLDTTPSSQAQVVTELAGHWTLDTKTPVSSATNAPKSPEPWSLPFMHSERAQNLIWVWTLQSEFVAETSVRVDVCERCDLTYKEEITNRFVVRHPVPGWPPPARVRPLKSDRTP